MKCRHFTYYYFRGRLRLIHLPEKIQKNNQYIIHINFRKYKMSFHLVNKKSKRTRTEPIAQFRYKAFVVRRTKSVLLAKLKIKFLITKRKLVIRLMAVINLRGVASGTKKKNIDRIFSPTLRAYYFLILFQYARMRELFCKPLCSIPNIMIHFHNIKFVINLIN